MGELKQSSRTMDDAQELMDIVMQVRSRLELQRALGVNWTPAGSPDHRSSERPAPAPVVSRPEKAPESVKTAPVPLKGLAGLKAETAGCARCALARSRSKVVFGEGNPEAVVVFIGEAPDREAEEQGSLFSGPSGQLLRDIIVKGMKLRQDDVYVCTVTKCRTPDGRKPDAAEIEACEAILSRQIKAIGPKIIVALGNTAAHALLRNSEGITTLRGTWHQYQGIPVMSTFHPSHLLKKESDKKLVWEDIKKVMAELERTAKNLKPPQK